MKLLITILTVFTLTGLTFGQDSNLKGPTVGDPAIDFNLPYATKDTIAADKLHLSTHFGKKNIVLAFYPADWSGGCTKEVCTLRDNFAELGELNAEVLGISGDYQFSHHAWAKALELPFTLVSDHSQAISRAYASFNPDNGYNRRTVYIIDKKGKIAYVDLAYSVRDSKSFENLKDALKDLK